jgi:hypothetical protein
MQVKIQFVHPIAPSPNDVAQYYMEDIWTSFSATTWGRCLRFCGALPSGVRVAEMRRTTDPETGLDCVLVFLTRHAGGMHCLKITKVSK